MACLTVDLSPRQHLPNPSPRGVAGLRQHLGRAQDLRGLPTGTAMPGVIWHNRMGATFWAQNAILPHQPQAQGQVAQNHSLSPGAWLLRAAGSCFPTTVEKKTLVPALGCRVPARQIQGASSLISSYCPVRSSSLLCCALSLDLGPCHTYGTEALPHFPSGSLEPRAFCVRSPGGKDFNTSGESHKGRVSSGGRKGEAFRGPVSHEGP